MFSERSRKPETSANSEHIPKSNSDEKNRYLTYVEKAGAQFVNHKEIEDFIVKNYSDFLDHPDILKQLNLIQHHRILSEAVTHFGSNFPFDKFLSFILTSITEYKIPEMQTLLVYFDESDFSTSQLSQLKNQPEFIPSYLTYRNDRYFTLFEPHEFVRTKFDVIETFIQQDSFQKQKEIEELKKQIEELEQKNEKCKNENIILQKQLLHKEATIETYKSDMKHVWDNIDKIQAYHLSENNKIFPNDPAFVHFYNESFLTVPQRRDVSIFPLHKKLVFINTTNSALCHINKNLFSLFPPNALISLKQEGDYSNSDFKPISEYSFTNRILMFREFLEIKELGYGGKIPRYIISNLLIRPIPKSYVDFKNKILYIEGKSRDFDYVENITQVADDLCEINLASDKVASDACDILKTTTGIMPLMCDRYSYFFVVNVSGKLSCVRLDNVLFSFKIMSTELKIDQRIEVGASVFTVKNYGQWSTDIKHLVWFSDGSTCFSYFVEIHDSYILISPANGHEDFLSHFAIKIENNVHFVKIDKKLESTGVDKNIVDRRGVFAAYNTMYVSSFQTIDKITISCRLTSFDCQNKKIFSRKNSEEKLTFTGATSQITGSNYPDSKRWHFKNPSKFTFRGFLDKFFYCSMSPHSVSIVLCSPYDNDGRSANFIFKFDFHFMRDRSKISFDEGCFTRANGVGDTDVGTNLYYYNGREGRLSPLKKLKNLDDLKDDRIFSLGSLKIEKTNYIRLSKECGSYVDDIKAFQSRPALIEYSTESSFSICYKLKEITVSNNTSFGFF